MLGTHELTVHTTDEAQVQRLLDASISGELVFIKNDDPDFVTQGKFKIMDLQMSQIEGDRIDIVMQVIPARYLK